MALLASVLDGVIARHGCAIVAAHHDRKRPPFTKRDSGTDRIRGSTALSGWLSFCLSLEKDVRVPDTLIAEWTKVRDAEEALADLTVTFDRETLGRVDEGTRRGGGTGRPDRHVRPRDAGLLRIGAHAGEQGVGRGGACGHCTGGARRRTRAAARRCHLPSDGGRQAHGAGANQSLVTRWSVGGVHRRRGSEDQSQVVPSGLGGGVMSLGNGRVANRLPTDLANLGWRLATGPLKGGGCQPSRRPPSWQPRSCQPVAKRRFGSLLGAWKRPPCGAAR